MLLLKKDIGELKMKNGISYPLAPEVIEMIEKKRKEYIKKVGFKVSQSNFTGIIASKLKPSIKKIKIDFKPRIKRRRKRK